MSMSMMEGDKGVLGDRNVYPRVSDGLRTGTPRSRVYRVVGTPMTPRVPEGLRGASAGGLRGVSAGGRRAHHTMQGHETLSLQSTNTVHTALEKDCTNHWTKWGAGGMHMSQELQHLADVLHQACVTEDGRWIPDARVKQVHDDLVFMAHGLSKQPPNGAAMDDSNPLSPLTPLPYQESVLKTENIRLRAELRSAKTKVTALEQTFAAYVRSSDTVKARDSWLQKYGLMGRFFAYNISVAARSFAAWSKTHACERRYRHCAKVGARSVVNARLHEDAAGVSTCLVVWAADTRMIGLRRRMIRNIGLNMERRMQTAIQNYMVPSWEVWVQNWLEARLRLEIAEAQQRTEDAIENGRMEKQRLLERFGAAAMATLRRKIGGDVGATMQKGFSDWFSAVEQDKAERKAKIEADARAARDAQRRFAAGERMFGLARNALLTQFIGNWTKVVDAVKYAKQMLEQGTSLAMKNIFGNEMALVTIVFNEWLKATKEELRRRQLVDMAAAKKLLELARTRAMNMIEKKTAGGNPGLECLDAWREQTQKGRLTIMRKTRVMTGVMNQLLVKNEMLMALGIGYWTLAIGTDRKIAKEKAAFEKAMRERFLSLAQGAIMRLHRRLACTHIFEAWLHRATGD